MGDFIATQVFIKMAFTSTTSNKKIYIKKKKFRLLGTGALQLGAEFGLLVFVVLVPVFSQSGLFLGRVHGFT